MFAFWIFSLWYLASAQTFTAAEVKPTDFKVGRITRYTFSATQAVANANGVFEI